MPAQGQAKRRSAVQPPDKPIKRTRVSRACDQCRIAREKCDGLQPACSTCATSKRRCTYTANPKKRGIQPGYIRTLELALAWLFQENPKNETSLNEKLAQEGASSLFLSRDSKESNRLHKRWRKAKFYTDVDKLLSGGEPSRHEQSDPLSPQSEEDDSDAEELITPDIGLGLGSSEVSQAKVKLAQPSFQQPIPPSQQLSEDDTTILMPPDSWRLLESYFTYTQCWLPICEKHDILKLSYAYPVDGLASFIIQANSGAHAELWSVLAVASLHDPDNMVSTNQNHPSFKTSDQLYDIARSLLPSELGSFEISHTKALLNLAIFNMTRSLPDAAWVLVGCASRILDIIGQTKLMANPRQKHVLSGCFLLDSMLALQLGRRPYLQKYDLEVLGKIDEDGLEEWQPWNGHSQLSLREQPRAPILALSTFSNLLDIIDILVDSEQSSVSSTHDHEIYSRLQSWGASLPSKLNYICSETASTPLTPPAVLLQTTYYCAALVARPSELWLCRLLEVIEQFQGRMGHTSLPPGIQCLMTVINKHIAHLTLDETTRVRLQRLQIGIRSTWPSRPKDKVHANASLTVHTNLPIAAIQLPLPDSVNISIASTQSTDQPVREDNAYTASTQPDALPPRRNTSIASDQPFNSLFIPPSLALSSDPRHPGPTGDLESFFDELASLDSAPQLENQPQFMQNLGFAPDANMADLFSEYIPMQSTAFLSQEETGAPTFDQYNFYNAS
ncbi:uncharacterized protein K460DRAFT_379924 [Cucurbitaria berberidis CBS 394.84]|uniref:Zn(2)-C6 fungal-type domain-containing protein n=1 Tax=Cucurbitaria berberidis CBS 394.84 TaxID=1168544 RepID=A0A9P4GAM7_9PLEO|nr:uncharacterized protein K460DRAFT_379924 [Cucurbitaria berberidis CBS 394.84]KAF1841947.1 hypothetical protein K460DRAFT_379924 [Cucurbitaria berberidis CBS 394.84]